MAKRDSPAAPPCVPAPLPVAEEEPARTPLKPVAERLGEPRGHLRAREEAFKKRRGRTPPKKSA